MRTKMMRTRISMRRRMTKMRARMMMMMRRRCEGDVDDTKSEHC